MLKDSPLIVIGYRGAEASITDHLLASNAKRTLNFKNGIYWCTLEGETVHPNVAALRRTIDGNFSQLSIAGFDELMADLSQELADEDLYLSTRASERGTPSVAFDDREVTGASYEDWTTISCSR